MKEESKERIYQDLKLVDEQFKEVVGEGKSENESVKVSVNGCFNITDISINPDLLKESNKAIEDNFIAAYNDAKKKMEDQVSLRIDATVDEIEAATKD